MTPPCSCFPKASLSCHPLAVLVSTDGRGGGAHAAHLPGALRPLSGFDKQLTRGVDAVGSPGPSHVLDPCQPRQVRRQLRSTSGALKTAESTAQGAHLLMFPGLPNIVAAWLHASPTRSGNSCVPYCITQCRLVTKLLKSTRLLECAASSCGSHHVLGPGHAMALRRMHPPSASADTAGLLSSGQQAELWAAQDGAFQWCSGCQI